MKSPFYTILCTNISSHLSEEQALCQGHPKPPQSRGVAKSNLSRAEQEEEDR